MTSIIVTLQRFRRGLGAGRRRRAALSRRPGGEQQREMAFRTGINIVMHALTGNYKADQVHVPGAARTARAMRTA